MPTKKSKKKSRAGSKKAKKGRVAKKRKKAIKSIETGQTDQTDQAVLSSDLLANIIVDTREQKPWEFDIKLPSDLSINLTREKLDAGDYSLVGFQDKVLIEKKKDITELAGNIGKNWDRFCRELELLSKAEISQIVVADDLSNIYSLYKGRKYKARYFNLSPDFYIKRIGEIQTRFGVPVIFMSTTYMAQKYVLNIFKNVLLNNG